MFLSHFSMQDSKMVYNPGKAKQPISNVIWNFVYWLLILLTKGLFKFFQRKVCAHEGQLKSCWLTDRSSFSVSAALEDTMECYLMIPLLSKVLGLWITNAYYLRSSDGSELWASASHVKNVYNKEWKNLENSNYTIIYYFTLPKINELLIYFWQWKTLCQMCLSNKRWQL